MSKGILIRSEEDLVTVGSTIAPSLVSGDILYLEGELGAGKTTVARGILRGLGYKGIVTSPTYTLLEVYEIGACSVVHFDLYRLESAQELEGIGIRDYLDSRSILLFEWPEKGLGVVPLPTLRIMLNYFNEYREVRFHPAMTSVLRLQ